MQAQAKLLAEVFDPKIVNLLHCLLRKEEVFYLRDLSRESGVSLATTHRIVQKLLRMGLVTKEVKDKTTSYQILKGSPAFRDMYSVIIGTRADPITMLRENLAEEYGDKASVYTYKKKVFVISSTVKPDSMHEILEAVREATGSSLKALLVSPTQFKQMKSMGLVD